MKKSFSENQSAIKEWLGHVNYDLKTAEAMLETGRYLYVGFLCQQAIEKLLKALYVKEYQATPPYVHNLSKLIDFLSFKNEIDEEKFEFIDELNSLYIKSRYGCPVEKIAKIFKKKQAADFYEKTERLIKWLKSKLK